LPSWNQTPAKQRVIAFVELVTDSSGEFFVEPPQRIATFDNDGTLWSEQPMYFQLAFALERVKALASKHPEWKTQQPFKAVLDNDVQALAAIGKRDLMELVMASHAGMTTVEFERIVKDWIATAKQPRFERPYTDLVYSPMLELLDYLRAHDFKTYIVSGGGIEFMRPWVEQVYGIPPEQVPDPRRQACAHAFSGSRFHRRQGRETCRHSQVHRPSTDCRVWQLRRRPTDVAVDRHW
jgi:hypothetical protein